MIRSFRILFSLLLFLPGPAAAGLPSWVGDPGYTARTWTRREGLPSDDVTSLLQARDGYLWFGSNEGLARFDGVQIRQFDAGNTPGLLLNRTVYLQEDDSSRVVSWSEAPWVAVGRSGAFTTVGVEAGLPSLGVYDVLSDHELIVGSVEGAWRLSNGRFELLHPDLAGLTVDALHRARDGRLYLTVRGRGLMAFANGVLSAVVEHPEPIRAFLESHDGSLWISDAGQTRHYENGVAVTEPVPAPDFLAEQPGSDVIWAGGKSGVFRRDPATGRWDKVHDAPCTALHVATDGGVWAAAGLNVLRTGVIVYGSPASIEAMADDREGNLWLATKGSGVICLSRSRVGATDIEQTANAVAADGRGGLWFSRNDGLVVHVGPEGRREIPAGTAVRSLQVDSDGTVYAASYDGLFVLRGDRFEPVPGAEKVGRLHGLVRSKSGELWASGFSKVSRFSGGEWKSFTEKDGVIRGPIRYQSEGPDGSLWFATPEGALRFRDESFRLFGERDGLVSKRIRAIHVDERGVTWIGTEGRGVNRVVFDAAGNLSSVGLIEERTGLFENGVKWIGGDDRGRLWFTSNRGVFCASRNELDALATGERATIHCTAFDERSGMPNSDCVQIGVPAGAVSGDVIGVPTGKGLAILPVEDQEDEDLAAPLLVEELVSGTTSWPAMGGSLTLPSRERNFEVRYTGVRFLTPDHLRFRYRLEGLDPNWIEAGARRTAYFTNIPPGNYTFRVQLANANGVWGGQEKSLHVIVPPLFWETPWFKALIGVALLFLGVVLYRLRLASARRRERDLEALVAERTRELERQAARLEELDQAKSRFFANVSHEFRTPLTLTIGPLEDLLSGMHGSFSREGSRELKTALDSSRAVLDLVNQILDLAKLESGRFRLRAREDDLVASLRRVAAEFLPLSERRRIALEIDFPDEPLLAWFDELLIHRVVRNLLGNAFKFTMEGGTVRVGLGRTDAGIEIRVRDSGMGIPAEEQERIFDRFHQGDSSIKSQPGTGIGLSLARELVELHKGTIAVESQVGQGTTFIVCLKAGRDHLRPEDLADGEVGESSGAPAPHEGPHGFDADDTGDMAAGATPQEGRMTVLIVEDHPQVRALVRKHLEPRYRILEAEDGRKGLDVALLEIPDLIVSDVMMPVMDGMELTKAVKESPEIGFVPVLLLTARADLDDRLTAYSRGADAYLAKPFEPRELAARIDGLIEERRRLKARYAALAPGLRLAGMTSSDEAYLTSVSQVIMKNLADEEFSVDVLAKQLGQTRTTLFRRLREAGNTTPSALIRRLRLEQACLMLEKGVGSVNEIAYGVGFKSVSHFCTAFRAAYGSAPGAWKTKGPDPSGAGRAPGA